MFYIGSYEKKRLKQRVEVDREECISVYRVRLGQSEGCGIMITYTGSNPARHYPLNLRCICALDTITNYSGEVMDIKIRYPILSVILVILRQ